MNLLRIQYFLKLCETLHFTDAARQLNISQPALTKAISQLENELGTRLIRREGKHTHLTRHGESARRKYQDLMQLVSAVEDDVKNIVSNDDEKIKIALTPTIDFSLFAQFLTKFYEKRPNVNYEVIDCGRYDAENMLLDGAIDCVFTNDCNGIQNKAHCIELYEDDLVVASSDDTQFKGSQWLESQFHNQKIERDGISSTQIFSQSPEPKCIANCSQQVWAQQLIRAGLGFSVLPKQGDRITGVQVDQGDEIVKKQMIYAALPVGRSDGKTFSMFVSMLKQYDWAQV